MKISSKDNVVNRGPWERRFHWKFLNVKDDVQINTEDNIDPTIPENREKIFKHLYETYEKIVANDVEDVDFEVEDMHEDWEREWKREMGYTDGK